MELPVRMIVSPSVKEKCKITMYDSYRPNRRDRRKIDYYFVSNKRTRRSLYDSWASPELLLAEIFEELPECGHPVSLDMKMPYYLYGIVYRSNGSSATTPSVVISGRKCIELRIDGVNTSIDVKGSKLVVIDHHNKLEYELVESFESKVVF